MSLDTEIEDFIERVKDRYDLGAIFVSYTIVSGDDDLSVGFQALGSTFELGIALSAALKNYQSQTGSDILES